MTKLHNFFAAINELKEKLGAKKLEVLPPEWIRQRYRHHHVKADRAQASPAIDRHERSRAAASRRRLLGRLSAGKRLWRLTLYRFTLLGLSSVNGQTVKRCVRVTLAPLFQIALQHTSQPVFRCTRDQISHFDPFFYTLWHCLFLRSDP